MNYHFLTASSAVALVFASVSFPAIAQESGADQTEDKNAPATGDIVVTGSHIVRTGFIAPTPVTTLDQEQLRALNPGNLNDALRQLPILSGSTGPRGTSGAQGLGGSFLDVRRLGAARTLTLLDGRRFVPASDAGLVDTALFPEALIKRIDIVTGGASAAYGSDAVAGVVNFVLDKEFTGLKGEVLGGIVDGGYAPEYKAALSYGTAFGGGRGHLLASVEHYNNEGIWKYDDVIAKRPGSRDCSPISNPGGTTARTFACNVRQSIVSNGGLITSGPLKGQTFDASGKLVPFDYGTLTSSTTQVGGDGSRAALPTVLAASKRTSVFLRGSWDLTDSITVYAEANYARTQYHFTGGFTSFQNNQALTIKADNAYITDALRQQMADAGVSSFKIGRQFAEIGRPEGDQSFDMYRAVAGIDGNNGGVRWSLYYQHGETHKEQALSNLLNVNKFLDAYDAVRAPDGSIVCRSTLSQPGNGCVPVNVMGVQNYSAAQIAGITGRNWVKSRFYQDVVSGQLSGDVLTLPAGPVTVAGGAEYRSERLRGTGDPTSLEINRLTGVAGPYQTGNFQPQNGSQSVAEGFVEIAVPLLRDKPFFEELELNGAARRTHYSNSGWATTWKLGATWRPASFIRFRATRSRDIRAPNLTELYNAGSLTRGGTVTDNFYDPPRTTAGVFNVTRGNPDLKPEVANTLTFGAVITPSFIPNLAISIDAYNIRIKDAINTSAGAADLTRDCRNGSQAACDMVERDPATGDITRIYLMPINFGLEKAAGVDVEVSYRFSLDQIGAPIPGDVSLRFLGTYVDEAYKVAPGAVVVDRTGDSSNPHWRWTFNTGYRNGPFALGAQFRYTGSGYYDSTTLSTDLPQRKIPGQVLVNANVGYDIAAFGGKNTLFFNVNNVFNREAPLLSTAEFYDTIGRTFRAGIRFEY